MTDAVRILLIEDNPSDARLIEELLTETATISEQAGTERLTQPELVHESRLSAGMDALDRERVDLVLLDLNLPDSGGLETVETVLDHTDRIPVVVLTGLRDSETGIRAVERGAQEYLLKDEISGDGLFRALHHAIERKERERELARHQAVVETIDDGVYTLDRDLQFTSVNEAICELTGYDREELLGAHASKIVSESMLQRGASLREELYSGDREVATIETEFRTADGDEVPVEVRFSAFSFDGDVQGTVGSVRDISNRIQRERTLRRQRDQLAAVNQLALVVQDVTRLLVETRDQAELEQRICDRLVETDSYDFAWIGGVDRGTDKVVPRASGGEAGDYLDEITITVDESDTGQGPTGAAIRTKEMQVVHDIDADPAFGPWRDSASDHDFASSAAIPIVYENRLYGALNVYTSRENAFDGREQEIVGQIGEIVGHALTAIERREALLSETLIELEFRIEDALEPLVRAADDDCTISFERTIQSSDDYIQYLSIEGMDVDRCLDAIAQLETVTEVRHVSETDDEQLFEVLVTEVPLYEAISRFGGRLASATMTNGDLRAIVEIPSTADVRETVEMIEEIYDIELLAQRTVTRERLHAGDYESLLEEHLTDRQLSVLETAYFSGFFEWPRESTGEEIASMMEISPATFSQHLRIGERKVFDLLLDDAPAEEDESTPATDSLASESTSE